MGLHQLTRLQNIPIKENIYINLSLLYNSIWKDTSSSEYLKVLTKAKELDRFRNALLTRMHFSCNMKAPHAKKTKQYNQYWKQPPKATIPNILIPSDTMYTLQVIRRKGPNKQNLIPVIEWWNKQPLRDGRMATERTWTTAYSTTQIESDNANIYNSIYMIIKTT